jgi:hypothetical protein
MMTLNILLAAWMVSIVLALLSIAVVIRPLQILLRDICGTADRARFWSLYASVLLMVAPLMVVSAPGLLDAVAASGVAPVLQRAVFYTLLGILVALMVMGYAVWRPIAAMTSNPRNRAVPPAIRS